MNVAELLQFQIKIEEGHLAKIRAGATPEDAAEYRVRAYRKLHDRATDPALDLEPEKPSAGPQGQEGPKVLGNPRATTRGNLVLPGQLGTIRAIARSKGVDPEEVCGWAYDCKTEDLNQANANLLIDYLNGLKMPGVKTASR